MDFLIPKVYAAGNDVAFNSLFNSIITNIVNPIIYLLMALAVVYFVWGVLMYIRNADNAEKKADGYKHMIWGIIGIFIMVSAKGIINLILASMGL